ncbi:hypothetical protein B296_00054347 [Ensete ventricosum]|uniref:Beta-fructofuranosidase N-terminal domain-containing protein n=1 Tax=Ensete ventricosum TaxID=4639 RepID=A0A426Y4A2_ENSVE|nr:hypothetical protein B296_00054347 [Ensete ventricosum]
MHTRKTCLHVTTHPRTPFLDLFPCRPISFDPPFHLRLPCIILWNVVLSWLLIMNTCTQALLFVLHTSLFICTFVSSCFPSTFHAMGKKSLKSWSFSSSSSTASSSSIPCSYPPLLHPDHSAATPSPKRKKCLQLLSFAAGSSVLIVCVVALVSYGSNSASWAGLDGNGVSGTRRGVSRGLAEGVSEKSSAAMLRSSPSYPWTNSMLLWQRTAFHFQPQKNWMNGQPCPRI